MVIPIRRLAVTLIVAAPVLAVAPLVAQLVDRTTAPNAANEGIALTLDEEIGAGRGDWFTEDSSAFIISRDPFRAIRRGRQLFQRKFTFARGQGPATGDGAGDIATNKAIGAGLADSCAACHGRPRGAAGFGGDVVTRPDSRDAPHLFGLGIKEMLADEMTAALRGLRDEAVAQAIARRRTVRRRLVAKGVPFGVITAYADGIVDTSEVEGVEPDMRIRPFGHGDAMSIREFVVGALNNEMGLLVADPDLAAAHAGRRIVTPSGMVLDGGTDTIAAPPDGLPELDPAVVDYFEFYLLNYFKPAIGEETHDTIAGRKLLRMVGCTTCHVQDLSIGHDRRVADVDTVFDPERGHLNRLFATARALFTSIGDVPGLPELKQPQRGGFAVDNIFTDFKRHDLGPAFHERQFDGSIRTEFMTTSLWGVGSTAPYGHDGRSINLTEVILRHGGEAEESRNAFASLAPRRQRRFWRSWNRSSSFRRTTRRRTWILAIRQCRAFRSTGTAASS